LGTQSFGRPNTLRYPLSLGDKVKLEARPAVNALASLIIPTVGAGVLALGTVRRRAERSRRLDLQTATRPGQTIASTTRC